MITSAIMNKLFPRSNAYSIGPYVPEDELLEKAKGSLERLLEIYIKRNEKRVVRDYHCESQTFRDNKVYPKFEVPIEFCALSHKELYQVLLQDVTLVPKLASKLAEGTDWQKISLSRMTPVNETRVEFSVTLIAKDPEHDTRR